MEPVPNTSLLLIGFFPSIRDYEIARMLGWYRIPLRFAPKLIDVDYFAFYQGANFGEDHRWKIEYFAEYRGHELTTRRELLREEISHPRANEEYYKIQLGPLVHIPEPIQAEKWKRITFLYTTGELFNHAKIINDLVMGSDDKAGLWATLRERNLHRNLYQNQIQNDFFQDPSILDALLNLNPLPDENDLNSF